MSSGKPVAVVVLALVCMLVLTGCSSAVVDGLLLGISGGVNAGVSSVISGLFELVTSTALGVEATESTGGGHPG